MKIFNKYEKNIRMALFKATGKNRQKYKYYPNTDRFEYIEGIKDMEELGRKALEQNKAPIYRHGTNLKFFRCELVAERMIQEEDWQLIEEFDQMIAIRIFEKLKYQVEVKKILSKVIDVDAENEEEAIDIVHYMYNDNKFEIDLNDVRYIKYKVI